MRHIRCSDQYRETVYGLNGGASWADKRREARPQDRDAYAKDVSTYGPLVQSVQYAVQEHAISEGEALERLDSMQAAELGLTVHQTAQASLFLLSLSEGITAHAWTVHAQSVFLRS